MIIDSTYIIDIDSNYIVIIDTNIVIDIDTTISHLSDTTRVPSDSLGRENSKTSISYIEIPILFGYEFNFKKVIVGVKGGIALGILTKTTGYYLNSSATDLIPINTGYAVIRKTIWNLQLGFDLGFKVHPKFDMFIAGGYKMNLNSVFSDKEVVQKYRAYNVALKLRYTF